ncbi:hypothetical protein [Tunicatimonas pelagia]|uniref:hypothetical protein n=1 Tax=Tunicatimonas pelagia TaxID=931531 RepID=UPI0026667162|nr:hypothetical protein [Tunicatimonas pelagia]WKN45171.1 hypothetical protein P0M28_09375 [Tunicatimonas pelagia]
MNSFISKIHYSFLVIAVTLTACTDDDEDADRRDMLIGTWEIQSGELVDYRVRINGINGEIGRDNVQTVALLIPEVAELDQDLEDAANVVFPAGTTVSFADNNDYTFASPDGTDSGTWSLSDNEETISLDVANELGLNQLNMVIESLTNQQISLLFSINRADVNLQALGVDELPNDIEDFTIEYRFQFIKQ